VNQRRRNLEGLAAILASGVELPELPKHECLVGERRNLEVERDPVLRALIATLAISLVGNQMLLWYFGPRAKSLPRLFGNWNADIFGVIVTSDKLGASASAIMLLTANVAEPLIDRFCFDAQSVYLLERKQVFGSHKKTSIERFGTRV